jgi:dipeptidyl aminopeptidase/acylaminoacyl peptidase
MSIALLAAAAKAAAPLEAYGRLPSIEQVTLSPDGSKIAFIETVHDIRGLAVIDLVESTSIGMSKISEQVVRSVQWADDTHLLMTTATSGVPMGLAGGKSEWRLMQVFDTRSRKWRPLLDHVKNAVFTMNVVLGKPIVQRTGKDTNLFIEGVVLGRLTHPAMFRISLTTGIEELVLVGSAATKEWVVDDSGEILAEQDYYEDHHRWTVLLLNGKEVRHTISGTAAIDTPEILGLSAAGDEILFAVNEAAADTVAWKPLSVRDGTWGAAFQSKERVSHLLARDGSNRMVGTAFVGDTTLYHFTDQTVQDSWDWVVRVFAYQRVELVSASADYSKFVVRVMGPKSGFAYYLADVKEHVTRPVGKVYEGIEQIAEVRPITYRASDGLEIPAYLTLPPDRPAKMLPVIMFPHGGPQSRDTLEFDWWAQAMAAQGYAVIQPNYRGSALGPEWIERGYGEWGRKMQTDLSDGLSYLAAQGIIDPQRACIVGASYGGYAALAGVSIQSGIYRCTVAVSGISDPANFMQWVKRMDSYGDQQGLRYWERFFGVDTPDDKGLDAISPLKNASRITVPVLLIHGRDDTTVPYDQSEEMANALKRAGKSVQYVTLNKEDHYLSRSATRLQMLESLMQFLKVNNPPD